MVSAFKQNVRHWPILATVAIAVLVVAQPALAQTRSDFLDLMLRIDYSGDSNRIWVVLRTILNFILLLGGILAFFYAIQGGFAYLSSGGDAGKADTGRKMITNAVIGIIIIFLSYALINFVVNRVATTTPDPVLEDPDRR